MSCRDDKAKAGFTENDIGDLTGYVAIVTGGNGGIGYETTYHLALKGARVYIASRSEERVGQCIQKMQAQAEGKQLDLHFLKIDLENLASLKAAAADFGQREAYLDLLINNAGIMNTPYAMTKDGFERQWQVNYIAPHVLDHFFLPYLLLSASIHEKQDRARVIHVSSDLSRMGQAPQLSDPNLPNASGPLAVQTRYSHSKQATIRDAHIFNEKYAPRGVTAYSLHPGLVRSGLQENFPSILGQVSRVVVGVMGTSALEACRNTLFASTSAQAAAIGQGQYFLPVGKIQAKDKWFAEKDLNMKLWEHGETQVRRLGALEGF